MSRIRRWLPVLGLSGLALAIAACGGNPPAGAGGSRPAFASNSATAVEIGAPLYAKAAMPKIASAVGAADPIVMQQATIAFDDKVQLAAQVDGVVELIATPLPMGTKILPGDSTIVPHPRDPLRLHRKLRENDPIVMDQILARLDESQIAIQLEGLNLSLKAAIDGKKYSDDVVVQTQEIVDAHKRASNSASSIEAATAKAQVARARESVAQTVSSIAKLQGERDVTQKRMDQYFIKSTVVGRVYKILKNPGEFAKAGEPVLEIQGTSRFRVEGNMDVQDASRLQLGQAAFVEPTRPFGPEPYSTKHRQAVSGVCVTSHKGRPLVVSAGLDATALVWDVTRTRTTNTLPHPAGVAVRCVAATVLPCTQHLVVTGTADGKVRIWDLGNPDQIPEKAMLEFEEMHTGPVNVAGFSPDGKYLATASGRDVYIWDIAARKKLYSLPVEHKDDVTSLRFTPQCTLLTVARDKTLRIWNLGQNGGNAEKLLEHRSGAVDILDVSTDGSRVLFDQDPGRLDIVSLADSRTLGSLINTGGSLRFAGLALFSPDDNLILTAGSDADSKGELQLWEKPQMNGRGSERRRLVTPSRATVTCAAFSPDPEQRFVIVGTQNGGLHYWYPPSAGEMNKSWQGKIVSITKTDSRTVNVRVEVDNPGGQSADWLQDRGTATVIFNPAAK